MNLKTVFLAGLTSLALSATTYGGIVVASGSIGGFPANHINTAPSDVTDGSAIVSDSDFWLFPEKQNVTVAANTVFADAVDPDGTYTKGDASDAGFIPEGTYNSFFYYSQPEFNSPITDPTLVTGTIRFTYPIVAIIFEDSTLDATAPIFGLPAGTLYTPDAEGIDSTFDNLTSLKITGNVIEYSLQQGGVDTFRVITAIPEPSQVIGGVALGFVGLSLVLRRLRQKAA
jgi:hypothetical protein